MREIVLIRHAQSANNARPEHLRVPDPGITEIGNEQVAHLATWIPHLSPHQLLSSGFSRALETASGISKALGLKIHVFRDIFEKGGCYSGYPPNELKGEPGMGREEILARFPNAIVEPGIGSQGWWHGQVYESMEEAWQRASKVARWLEVDPLFADRRSAMVIHADFKKILVATMLNQPGLIDLLEDPFNTSVSILTLLEDRWKLIVYNSIGHLPSRCIT